MFETGSRSSNIERQTDFCKRLRNVMGRLLSDIMPCSPIAFFFITALRAGAAVTFQPEFSTLVGPIIADQPWIQSYIASDTNGNIYVSGPSPGPEFSATKDAFDTVWSSNKIFIVKLDPTGRKIIYSTFLGGNGFTTVWDIAVDSQDQAIVVGHTKASDFPTTSNALDRTFNKSGLEDGFIAKLSSDGQRLVYGSFFGGERFDSVFEVELDSHGSLYLMGGTLSPDLPTTDGAFDRTYPGANQQPANFVAKLAADGTELVYSTYLGGEGLDNLWGLAVDASGSAVAAGVTWSTNYPTTTNAWRRTLNGKADLTITQLGPKGEMLFSSYFGGSGIDNGSKLHFDEAGRLFIAANTDSDDYPTTEDAHDKTFNGGKDVVLTVLDLKSRTILYSTYLGGSRDDYLSGIALLDREGIGLSGFTHSEDFPRTGTAAGTSLKGSTDCFVSIFDWHGRKLTQSRLIGGSGVECGGRACASSQGRFLVTGQTQSQDFPAAGPEKNLPENGSQLGKWGGQVFVVGFPAQQ